MAVLKFPRSFLWGAATASYQIEGSPLADGAGASIWHTFAHMPGTIVAGDTGDVACDHYNRWHEDIERMRWLGLRGYRFSIAWPRVLPDGRTKNAAGIGFYDRLVDGLLSAGITPMATLYHWDLPQALEDAGGWPEPALADRYTEYAECMFAALGDRVKHWITFNEPWVFTYLGYGLGVHAPGRSDPAAAIAAAHNVLRAHGGAVERYRTSGGNGQIGITLSVQAQVAASDDPRDHAAVTRASAFHNEWFIEPIMGHDYPRALREQFGALVPELSAADAARIAEPIDFIGLNYYTRAVVAHDDAAFLRCRVQRPVGQYTAMDWEVYPAGLYQLLKTFHARYRLPLYVTESGAAFEGDTIGPDGEIHDTERLRYLQSHIEMCHRALAEGVDLRGYLMWTLLDNFEWAFGYAKRFGLFRCDFATQERTPKLSASWYRGVIADDGI